MPLCRIVQLHAQAIWIDYAMHYAVCKQSILFQFAAKYKPSQRIIEIG